MATKTTTFTLNENQTSSEVTSHATVTGRTVYGRIVSATETIKQDEYIPPVSSFDLQYSGGSDLIPWDATSAHFTLYYENIDIETIDVVASGCVNIGTITKTQQAPGVIQITASITNNYGDSTRLIRLEMSGYTTSHSEVMSDFDFKAQDYIHGHKFIISGATKGVTIVNDTDATIKFNGLQIYCGNNITSRNPLQVYTSGGGITLPPHQTEFAQSAAVISGMTNALWAYANVNLENLPSPHVIRLSVGSNFSLTQFGPEYKKTVENDVVTTGNQGTIILRISNN